MVGRSCDGALASENSDTGGDFGAGKVAAGHVEHPDSTLAPGAVAQTKQAVQRRYSHENFFNILAPIIILDTTRCQV